MEICENCHAKPATLHFAHIEEGESTQRHYCEECAEELGIEANDPTQAESYEEESEEEEELLSCPVCTTTQAEFEETHTVGCTTCYTTFAQSIQQRKSQFNGLQNYRGKKYRSDPLQAYGNELEQLKIELKEAVSHQKFELASVLRDRIQLLESTRS